MVTIIAAQPEHFASWSKLRAQLWPEDSAETHLEELKQFYGTAEPRGVAFLAVSSDGTLCGFAEACLRRDYVEGCTTSPVAFLEGIFVSPEMRVSGVARQLAQAIAQWGRDQVAREFASDTGIDNVVSQAFHEAIGFSESARNVTYRMDL